MARPTDIVRTLLLAAPAVVSSVVTADWCTHISKVPTTPHRVIGLFDTGGVNPNPAILLDFKTVQVQVRGGPNDNELTFSKAQAIKDRLLGIDSQTVLGDRLCSLTMIGDITFMGRNDQDQPLYSINFRLIIEPATNSLTNRVPV